MSETAFGYFPDYPVDWDYKIRRKYRTRIIEFKTGREQRRRMYPSSSTYGTGRKGGYGYLSVSTAAYTAAQRYAVASFLDSAEGAFKAFYLFRTDRDTFVNYEVGSVTSETEITIPFKDSVISQVTINDVVIAYGTDVSVNGEDIIEFTPPQTGVVRVNLVGRERWLVRAEDDEVVESLIANVANDHFVISLGFKQVR